MSKLSFFYNLHDVYKVSLRALERREYNILEADEENGIIRAESRKGILKPNVSVEIKISSIADNQTRMDIQSKLKRGWLTADGYEAKAENKLINTLYRLFESKG